MVMESILPSGMKTGKHNRRKFRLYPSRAQGDHTERKIPMMRLAGNTTHCHQQTSWSPRENTW